MSQLREVEGSLYFYGDRVATAFEFENGVKIIGFKNGFNFDLRVLSVGKNPKRKGLGKRALRTIRPLFREITVNEINEDVLPFWRKMKDRGLVNRIGTMKGELVHRRIKKVP